MRTDYNVMKKVNRPLVFQFPVVHRMIVLSPGADQMNEVSACIAIPGLQNCTFANCCKALSALVRHEENPKIG